MVSKEVLDLEVAKPSLLGDASSYSVLQDVHMGYSPCMNQEWALPEAPSWRIQVAGHAYEDGRVVVKPQLLLVLPPQSHVQRILAVVDSCLEMALLLRPLQQVQVMYE